MTLLLLACLIAPQDPALDKKVAALVQRLASDDLDEREGAQKELNSLGPSIKARIESAIPGASPEVAARLRAVLDNFAWEDQFKNSLPSVARFTLDKKKRTLEELLAVIREKTGWTVRVAAMNLREPVDLGWTDAPALQILDDACRALRRGRVNATVLAGGDRHPRFDREDSDSNEITLNGGESSAPAVAYWNQFRAELESITIVETRNYSSTESTASLSLQLSAQPGVSVMKAGNWIIDEITDDRGRSLKGDAKPSPFSKRDPETGDARDSVWFTRDDDFASFHDSNLEFEVPGPEATRIASLKARIRVTLPGKKIAETRKVADVKDGGEIRLGDSVITISKAGMEEGEFKLTYRAAGKHQGTPSFELLDAEGRPVRTSGSGSSSNRSTIEAEWRVGGEVASLRVTAILGHRTIEIPFELKDIPLPKGD